jgi:hypothetical protein
MKMPMVVLSMRIIEPSRCRLFLLEVKKPIGTLCPRIGLRVFKELVLELLPLVAVQPDSIAPRRDSNHRASARGAKAVERFDDDLTGRTYQIRLVLGSTSKLSGRERFAWLRKGTSHHCDPNLENTVVDQHPRQKGSLISQVREQAVQVGDRSPRIVPSPFAGGAEQPCKCPGGIRTRLAVEDPRIHSLGFHDRALTGLDQRFHSLPPEHLTGIFELVHHPSENTSVLLTSVGVISAAEI